MKIKVDTNGKIIEYACDGSEFEDSKNEIIVTLNNDIYNAFIENPESFIYQNNEVINNNLETIIDYTVINPYSTIEALRIQRSRECFSIINRGFLWYNSLTDIQKQELQSWYQKWLDVTETLKVPSKPNWIKEENIYEFT